MLATRAAADPELKALMQLVASKRADQAQLRRFQAHIDELHAIIAQRNREAAAAAAAAAQQQAQQQQIARAQAQQQQQQQQQRQGQGANMVFYSPAQSTGAVSGTATGPLRPHPQPQQQQQQRYQTYQGSPGSGISPVAAAQGPSQGTYPTQQPRNPPPPPPPPPQPVQKPTHRAHPPPPPKPEPKAVVFEFLTPSATQVGLMGGGHGGGKDNIYSHVSAGDRYLFPANTILDYFPGGTTVIASFLAIKKVDEREPYVDLSVRQNVRGKYQKKGKKDKEKEKEKGKDDQKDAGTDAGTDEPVQPVKEDDKEDVKAQDTEKKDEKKDEEEKSDSAFVKEYYQPVTMRLHASNLRILEPLAKIVNPPAQVRKYMNEVMDRLPRADIEYLALRLPREGTSAAQGQEEVKEG